jgi:hypothetical protein
MRMKATSAPPKCAEWATDPLESIAYVMNPITNTIYLALMGIGGNNNIISRLGKIIP